MVHASSFFAFSAVSPVFPPGGPLSKEDLTINYGILGGQFHFEKSARDGGGGKDSGDDLDYVSFINMTKKK